MVDIDKILGITREKYNNAKKSIRETKAITEHFVMDSAISDTVPGYSADDMKFEAYEKDNFGVLFVDIRNSTNRAKSLGPKNTFLSMHVFIPAMIEVVEHYQGNVIDIMGDGLMVFFGGRKSSLTNDFAVKNAGLCGLDMLLVRENVVNIILKEDSIPEIDLGIGVDYGDVIVTKIGINNIFDVKAFGDCINKASQYSDGCNTVKVSKYIRHHWPKGKNGKISFSPLGEDKYKLVRNAVNKF